jgi:hypothetical protein
MWIVWRELRKESLESCDKGVVMYWTINVSFWSLMKMMLLI